MQNYKKSILGIIFLCAVVFVFCQQGFHIEAKEAISVITNTTKYTNKNVKITITFPAGMKVSTVKYVSGSHSRSFTNKNGKTLKIAGNKASVSVSKNATYTFYYVLQDGGTATKKITVKNIDKTKPTMNPTYKVMNQSATITLNGSDKGSGLSYVKYVKGTLTDPESAKWSTKAKTIKGVKVFSVASEGNYSILIADKAGNKFVKKLKVTLELRAAWISYLEYNSAGVSEMTQAQFQTYINNMFDKCIDMSMNTVIVQVRPSGDALYKSSYFPWSSYVSGKQGTSPGYDPLAYMVKAAHSRGLSLYAWINPYRVSATSTSVGNLSVNNQARKWRSSNSSSVKRNVLTYNSQLYYNPSKSEVRTLIVNGVKEIVKNYDVEGIIFDDYFYPNLGTGYKTNFDYTEYKQYKAACELDQTTAKSIVNWRRSNVNVLLKRVKAAIKSIDSSVEFGVSPQGNLTNLSSVSANYCDVSTWMNSTSYIDFIAPQIYWSTSNSVSPYEKVVNQWIDKRTSDNTKIYVAIAVYKAGLTKKEANALSPADLRWYSSRTNLKEQVSIGRETGEVDGFMFYRYDNMVSIKAATEMENLLSIL